MSHTALVVVALIVVLAITGSIDAVDSDPLGAIAAFWLIVASVCAIAATYVVDAIVRSFRKVRELETSEGSAEPRR